MLTKRDFERTTEKRVYHRRSNALKRVDDAIGAYHRNSNENSTRTLANAIVQWAVQKGVKANGNINTGRDERVIRELVAEVGALRGGGGM